MKNRKIACFVLCLALAGLACLDTSAAIVPTLVPAQATSTVQVDVTATTLPTLEPLATVTVQPVCAQVVADTAVHLRGEADSAARILTHLRNGDEVHVINRVGGDWWLVTRGGYIGFVKADYLKELACVK